MGGFRGFENEPFRQECLKSVFRENIEPTEERKALLLRTTKSNISFQDYCSDIPESLQSQYPRHLLESQSYENFSGRLSRDSVKTRFGIQTGYGLTQGQHYDRISSISTSYLPYVVPPLQAHGKRIPVNILPEEEIYEDEDEEHQHQQQFQLPRATSVGIVGPPGTAVQEFQSVNNAMTAHQFSNTWKNYDAIGQRQNLCSSYSTLSKDRLRHLGIAYTPISFQKFNPQISMTASQEIGRQLSPEVYKRPLHGMRGCRETRFAQSMLVMAKSPFGHVGQSCL